MRIAFKICNIVTIALFILNGNLTFGQILNVDRELNDTFKKNWYVLVTAEFSKDKQKNDINDLNAYLESVYKLKRNYGVTFIGQSDLTKLGSSIVQSEGFFQLRMRDLDSRKNSLESFVQYQWNGAWGMLSRKLLGANFRRRILEKNGYDLYLGLGLFYQSEKWNYQGVSDQTKIPLNQENVMISDLRSNIYIKGALKIFTNCDIVIQSYFQSQLSTPNNMEDYRFYLNTELNYNITDNFILGFNSDITVNNLPPVPINKIFYSYKTSLRIKI